MLKGVVLAVIAILLFLVVHVTIFRISVPRLRFIALTRLACVIGLLYVLAYLLTPPTLGFLPKDLVGGGWAIDFVNGMFIYVFLFIGYSMSYFLVDRGFSARIMVEIEQSPERRLVPDEIARRYSIAMVLDRRLNEMLEIGQIHVRDGRYRNTEKGHRAASVFRFAKRFLQLGEGG